MSEPTKAELEAADAAHDQARDAGAAAARAALAAGAASTTYAIQPGDTLESIAEAIYGDADQDAHFFASAGAVIGTNPSEALPAGAVLTIPAVGAIAKSSSKSSASAKPKRTAADKAARKAARTPEERQARKDRKAAKRGAVVPANEPADAKPSSTPTV